MRLLTGLTVKIASLFLMIYVLYQKSKNSHIIICIKMKEILRELNGHYDINII